MKRWLVIHVIMLLVATMLGQVGKTGFADSGLMGIKTTEEALKLDSGIDFLYTDEDYKHFLEYENTFSESLDKAPIIIVGTSTGEISQYHFSLAQEIKVERVIKGNPVIANSSAYVYGELGFSINKDLHDNLTYYSVKNLMQPGQQYLLFLQPLELNNYLTPDGYRLIDSVFNYLSITSSSTKVITVPLGKLKFADLQEVELFTNSELVLKQFLQIKKRIFDKYLGNGERKQLN